jgi:hypothetical protein
MGDLARILLVAPFTAVAIAAEQRLAPIWPLPFPRSLDEIDAEPARLLALLTQPSRGLIARPAIPPGAVFAGLGRRGGPDQEPDKQQTTGMVEMRLRSTDGTEQSSRLVVKLQSGRGMPFYMQALRAALEPFSREIEFYRRLAPVVPVPVARPLFADAVTFVNRVPTPESAWIPARTGLDYAKFVEGFIAKTEPTYRDVWSALQRYFAPRPVTLAHGDCRPGNMLFTGEGEVHAVTGSETDAAPWPGPSAKLPGVVMSDWEAVNIAPLLWDFTYATIIGLRIGDREAWLDRLLDEFLASLQENGVPAAELDRSTRRLHVDLLALVLAYISLVVFEHKLWNGQGNTLEDIRAWGGRVRHAALVSDATAMAAALGLPVDTVRGAQRRFDEGLAAVGRQ